jgi:glutamyl-tRNA synthetase
VTAKGIKEGAFSGWDDPRLGTLRALRRRGIRPEAIRRYWIETGIKEVDIEFSWKTLYSFNRELIDDSANRYFFVNDPVKIWIEQSPELTSRAPLHPEHPERGVREYRLGRDPSVYVSREDIASQPTRLRLKDLCNIELVGDRAKYAGNDLGVLKEGVQIAHWVPDNSPSAEVLMSDGTVKSGYAERKICDSLGKVVQLERFAYAMVEQVSPTIRCVFTHK